MDIEVSTEIPSEEAVRRLNAVMVDGIQVLSYRRIEDGKAGKAMSLVAAADYTLGFRSGHEPAQEWKNRIDAFMAQSSINILKKTKRAKRSGYQTHDL